MFRSLIRMKQLFQGRGIFSRYRCLSVFCTNKSSNKAHSVQIARQMLGKYQQYRPWKTIHLIHTITMARMDPEFSNQASQFRQDEQLIDVVLNSISSEMHLVPHKQVNMLLDILKERGYLYNLDQPIFRAINKQIKMLFGKQFKQEMLSKTLFLLKTLKFPKLTINKILDQLAELLVQLGERDAKNNYTLTNILKIAIFSLEEPYITIPIVKKWMELAFQLNADTLSSLCSLYHINLIAQKCLRAKVDYQYKKTNSKQILFNPYNQIQEENNQHPQQKSSEQPSQNIDNQRLLEIKRKLTDMSNQILKRISAVLDAKKLQAAIVKNVQDNVQPFTKDLILYSCDISQLKPIIEQYVASKTHQLTPVELIYLLKRCSKDTAQTSIDSYLVKLGQHMSVQQQAYVHIEARNLFHRAISKDIIIKLLQPLNSINYQQFMAIVRLIELLPSAQQNSAGQILQLIKQKMVDDGEYKADK